MMRNDKASSVPERPAGDREPELGVLTNRRLIFEPASRAFWYARLSMPRNGLNVGQSGPMRQLLYRFIEPNVSPTYLHTAKIKVSRGRKTWFRVHDAEEWKRALGEWS